MATLSPLGLQSGIRVKTRVVSVERKGPMGQVCMMLSLGCVGVRKGSKLFFKKAVLCTLFPQSKRKNKRKRTITLSHSPACFSFGECNYALLYLRAIQTIIIPMTLKDSSEVEWHLLLLKTFGQRPEFLGILSTIKHHMWLSGMSHLIFSYRGYILYHSGSDKKL